MDHTKKLANRMNGLSASAIREIFKVVSRTDIISLAGGVPSPESFPVEIIRQLSQEVIDKYGAEVFQYGVSEGLPELRSALANLVKECGIDVDPSGVCTSTGSQNALDVAARVLINKNDLVLVESPTYLTAIKAFKTYEAKLEGVATDDEGMIPEKLEEVCKREDVKLVYLVPNFQNPTGRTLGLERRKKIADIVKKYDLVLIEDDPYGALRYYGESIVSIKSLISDNVVYLGSLSKIFAPGLRLGFYIAPKVISEAMTSVRQSDDLHANSYSQALAAEYIDGGHLSRQLVKIKDLYRSRLEVMLKSLSEFMPSGITWSKPEGGMFVWLEASHKLDVKKVYEKSLERKVAFVPGRFFFVDESEGISTIRLNFTNVNEENIARGVKIIAEVIQEKIK